MLRKTRIFISLSVVWLILSVLLSFVFANNFGSQIRFIYYFSVLVFLAAPIYLNWLFYYLYVYKNSLDNSEKFFGYFMLICFLPTTCKHGLDMTWLSSFVTSLAWMFPSIVGWLIYWNVRQG